MEPLDFIRFLYDHIAHPLTGWMVGGVTFLMFYRRLWKDEEHCRHELEKVRRVVQAVTISNGILWNRLVLAKMINEGEENPVESVLEGMRAETANPPD